MNSHVMHVVVTAGHVDHGKSTLIQALTGQDPDRLDEEKRRGLSIQLGYCWTTWPEVGDVAFVDVPGHERFLATTLSGMGPVPVVLFVVAADDPWMPQSAEHLAALDALGVDRGVLVVTRSDLADPGPALARARAEVDGTSLAGIAEVVVSGRTGTGLGDLRGALSGVLGDVPRPDPSADVRLWVDRRFHVTGAGTVVTGTLPAGTISVGDVLEGAGGTVRVRGVEVLGRAVEAVSGPARVALRLGGRVPDDLDRGGVLATQGAFDLAQVVDVAVGVGRGDVTELPAAPLLHVGSASTSVHTRPLADEYVRLSLRVPLPLRHGDRAVLRDPGSRALWGVRVRDVAPPRLRRRGAAARAKVLASLDGTVAAEVAARGLVHREALRRWGTTAGGPAPGTVEAQGWLVAPPHAAELAEGIAELARQPRGTTAPAAADQLGLPDPALVAALARPPVTVDRGRFTVAQELDGRLAAAWERLRDRLTRKPFDAPDADVLAELRLDPDDLAALDRAGMVIRLSPVLVLLPSAADSAVRILGALPQPFSVSDARQALGSSRRVTLPLLDRLDRHGRTVRLHDDRRRVRSPE